MSESQYIDGESPMVGDVVKLVDPSGIDLKHSSFPRDANGNLHVTRVITQLEMPRGEFIYIAFVESDGGWLPSRFKLIRRAEILQGDSCSGTPVCSVKPTLTHQEFELLKRLNVLRERWEPFQNFQAKGCDGCVRLSVRKLSSPGVIFERTVRLSDLELDDKSLIDPTLRKISELIGQRISELSGEICRMIDNEMPVKLV